jgi:phosphoribosylanthranilate isomerase
MRAVLRRPRVKICGLTRPEDAALAVDLGADAVGFIFWRRSPRAIDLSRAAAIARGLPSFVTRVGVFVNPSPAEVSAVVDEVGLDVVQLHGDEQLDAFAGVGARLLRALALTSDDAVAQARAVPASVMLLVDAHDPDRRGGTGRSADWARARRLAAERPVVLAGGLTAANVRQAIAEVGPWAVDISSGVESSPGIKDPDRLRQLFAAVGAAQGEGL